MRYVAIDTETTGLGPSCELLELAMVLEDTKIRPLPPVEELPHFVTLVGPRGGDAPRSWEQGAMDMHIKSGLLAELRFPGLRPREEALVEAENWLAQHGEIHSTTRKRVLLTPAGKNFAGFDRRFLTEGILALLHHRALDPGSVFVDFDKPHLPGMNDLIDYSQKPGAHHALEDARDVVRVLRRKYT